MQIQFANIVKFQNMGILRIKFGKFNYWCNFTLMNHGLLKIKITSP